MVFHRQSDLRVLGMMRSILYSNHPNIHQHLEYKKTRVLELVLITDPPSSQGPSEAEAGSSREIVGVEAGPNENVMHGQIAQNGKLRSILTPLL